MEERLQGLSREIETIHMDLHEALWNERSVLLSPVFIDFKADASTQLSIGIQIANGCCSALVLT